MCVYKYIRGVNQHDSALLYNLILNNNPMGTRRIRASSMQFVLHLQLYGLLYVDQSKKRTDTVLSAHPRITGNLI